MNKATQQILKALVNGESVTVPVRMECKDDRNPNGDFNGTLALDFGGCHGAYHVDGQINCNGEPVAKFSIDDKA
jgi:hypothetical protein